MVQTYDNSTSVCLTDGGVLTAGLQVIVMCINVQSKFLTYCNL